VFSEAQCDARNLAGFSREDYRWIFLFWRGVWKIMSDLDDFQIPLFVSITLDELRKVLTDLRQTLVPPGTIIFHEGDAGDTFYVILEGSVDIILGIGIAEERLISTMTRGEYFGEMNLLNPQSLRSATALSRTGARLLEISGTEFNRLLRNFPEAAFDLAKVLSSRLRATDSSVIRELKEKNRQLEKAYKELQASQADIIKKEKLEHELRVAWEIQSSMLPRSLPHSPAFDFGARIVPARIVGGDFYDFIPLSDKTLGIVVGDVSGKGTPAALFMAMVQSLMRTEARLAASVEEALQGVNRNLLEANDSQMFVTILYGVLNRQTCEFHYGRAGHEVPIVCNAQGISVIPFRGHGEPLGIIPHPTIDEQTVELCPGDTLLIFSDGITDAFDEKGVAFGVDRLREALDSYCNEPPQEVCDRLIDSVMEYQYPMDQHDDVTVVTIRASSTCKDR
jgi:phosphoserine phosphatase RsbU/P